MLLYRNGVTFVESKLDGKEERAHTGREVGVGLGVGGRQGENNINNKHTARFQERAPGAFS